MSDPNNIPEEFRQFLNQIKGRRSRIVVEHILKHGFITTEDLEVQYGYKHPPRAIRDVREQGVPIETFKVKNAQGKSIAAYRFGEFGDALTGRIGGRRQLPKAFKQNLVTTNNSKCESCSQTYTSQNLQVDHRIPYQVSADIEPELSPDRYMLLCGSCNRAKSWSCEHCDNWLEYKNLELCQTCYWANPQTYDHIALQPVRQLIAVWMGDEIKEYEELTKQAESLSKTLPDYVKSILRNHLK